MLLLILNRNDHFDTAVLLVLHSAMQTLSHILLLPYFPCTLYPAKLSLVSTQQLQATFDGPSNSEAINKVMDDVSTLASCRYVKINVSGRSLWYFVGRVLIFIIIPRHPNLLNYYYCWGPDSQGRLWIVTDLCEMESVVDILSTTRTALTEGQVRSRVDIHHLLSICALYLRLFYVVTRSETSSPRLMTDKHSIIDRLFGVVRPERPAVSSHSTECHTSRYPGVSIFHATQPCLLYFSGGEVIMIIRAIEILSIVPCPRRIGPFYPPSQNIWFF